MQIISGERHSSVGATTLFRTGLIIAVLQMQVERAEDEKEHTPELVRLCHLHSRSDWGVERAI